MSQPVPSSISPNLMAFLAKKEGKPLTSADMTAQYMPSVLSQKIFDGFRKTKHPIYPVWRKLQHPKNIKKVSETFRNFGYFWEWYKDQVSDVADPLKKDFKVVRMDLTKMYEPSNCKLVELTEAYNYYDLINHLPVSSFRDFHHLIDAGHSAQTIGEYFKWTSSRAARIVGHYRKLRRAEQEAKANAPKEKTMSQLMRE